MNFNNSVSIYQKFKRHIALIILIFTFFNLTFYSSNLGAEDYTWTGAVDTVWTKPGNWAPTATTWTPVDISPDLWLDASDVSTFTKDGSELISQWNDKSSNARHVTQDAAASSRPTYVSGQLDGKAVVSFDGVVPFS